MFPGQDPLWVPRADAERPTRDWIDLDNVLRPFGFLAAHDETGRPAALVMKVDM